MCIKLKDQFNDADSVLNHQCNFICRTLYCHSADKDDRGILLFRAVYKGRPANEKGMVLKFRTGEQ